MYTGLELTLPTPITFNRAFAILLFTLRIFVYLAFKFFNPIKDYLYFPILQTDCFPWFGLYQFPSDPFTLDKQFCFFFNHAVSPLPFKKSSIVICPGITAPPVKYLTCTVLSFYRTRGKTHNCNVSSFGFLLCSLLCFHGNKTPFCSNAGIKTKS